jgi:hypothetical protein
LLKALPQKLHFGWDHKKRAIPIFAEFLDMLGRQIIPMSNQLLREVLVRRSRAPIHKVPGISPDNQL